MSIVNYTYDEFGTKLNELVSVAQPIQSIQHLLGREAELAQISKALFSPGRSIFIYGYRGVGKSSLAASAANQYQSPDNSYIDISCSPDTTLLSLVINIANEVSGHSLLVDKTKSITKDLGLKYLSFKNNIVETPSDLNNRIKSISDAISLLKEVSEIHSERPIVVVDEFDRIESDQERGKFADLLKQLGDKKINLKFIFTGVASTLSHLLGSHASTIRQLETIELSKLNWSARWDILVYAAKAFDIEVDEEVKIRIAAISDGYPYYVHLITEKLLWRVFDGDEDITVINKEHFNLALHDAINGISASLKQLYDLAVNRRELQYEAIIWATADSEYLQNHINDMYSSYTYITKQLDNVTALKYEVFQQQIRNLKSPKFGEVLKSDSQRGFYTYKEKMLRGFVRLQAEANGIELIGAEPEATEKQYMKVPTSSSLGYYESRPPKGIHFGRTR